MNSSDESDGGPQQKRKRKSRVIDDSPASTSSGSPIIGGSTSRRRRALQSRIMESSDTDNSDSPILHRRKIVTVSINSDSDSSDDSVIRTSRAGKPRQLVSDSECDSDSQWTSDFSEDETRTKTNSKVTPQESNIDSDVSDGQSEKCPICLARFRTQEIGTPESCDHTFCLECIQEWSKNMNTCPVDRQEFNLILVRKMLDGKVCHKIPITKPTPQNDVDIIEDPTYCEVCGTCDNEDRMLLCDGCDLGFHLFCLTPPLDDIPTGAWYCNDCSPDDVFDSEIELYEVQLLLDDTQSMYRTAGMRPRTSNRLIPRTQQSERVRRQIENNRQQFSINRRQNNSMEISDQVHAIGSTSTRKRTTRRRTRRSRQSTTRTVYEIDAVSGETVAVQRPTRNKKKKTTKKKKGDRIAVKPKTVKKRLAQQLGICKPRTDPQHLPDVAIPNPQGRIQEMRFSAGIPNIDLFGNRQVLDYFSDDDDEEYSIGSQLLTRRAPNRSDVNALRRAVRRKASISLPEAVSSTTDLLDNLLSSQAQFLSRNATYSIDSSGKFKIEKKESSSKEYVDVNKEKAKTKETPYYNNNRNYNNRYQHNRYQNNRYNNRHNNYSYNQNQNYSNSEPSSSMGFSRYSDNRGRDNYDCPQDYTQRTLCASTEYEYQDNKAKEENINNQNNESEVDIYSDIETVSTSKVDDNDYGELMKPPTPPELPDIADMYPNEPHVPNAYADEDNDSENDMVIDDEKVQEQESNEDDKKEEAAVTSTVDYSNDIELPSSFYGVSDQDNHSAEIQSGAVQSSNLDQIKNYQSDDEESADGCPNSNIYSKETLKSTNEMDEQDSDDGCPNFSIYSKESKTVALHTDISISQKMTDPTRDQQVGEISSSPNIESTCQRQEDTTNCELQISFDAEQLYDPENMYDPEESLEGEGERSQNVDPNEKYDPEQCFGTDETLDDEKMSNSDQTYDPEKAFEDDNSMTLDKTFHTEQSCDVENEIHDDVSINTTQTDNDRYDPEMPFDDDLNEEQDLPKSGESHTIEDEQKLDISHSNISEDTFEEGKPEKGDTDVPHNKYDIAKSVIKGGVTGGLYSDSEDEGVVKIDNSAFAISDINDMTEDISEEERSYTPCMDEKSQKQGLEGLDTELISDEDRNDFDESHLLKNGSDQGDALEINAKESELDFTRPEDYEEGEIVDKNKDQSIPDEELEVEPGTPQRDESKESNESKEIVEKSPVREKTENKENDGNNKESSFKKLSKSTKDRNYRDKDKDKEKGKGKDKDKRPSSSRKSKDRDQRDKREKRKEKRREIERYNVRALIAEKPRSIIAKDQFGRDIRDTPSRSRSRSYTPPIRRSVERNDRSPSRERSLSRRRRSPSKEIVSRKRRGSPTSRSRSPVKKRSRSKNKKRKRSPGRFKKRRSSRERSERAKPKKRARSHSRNRSRSDSALRRQRDWEKEWTLSPPPMQSQISPSWTPPRVVENPQVLRNENLTVTLNNTVSTKKKKEKRKKGEKRNKDGVESRSKKRRSDRERTPPPSKEVFASGDNILVSVSFNNENESRDITTREKRKNDESGKKKKEKKKKSNKRDLTGVKPVAIIDLDRSPFRELTPSPKQVIILSDSDNEEAANLRNVQQSICDSSQQVASPEHAVNYTTGPKTPPEPQVKFSLNAKPAQVRAIINPLHDPDDIEPSDHVEEEELLASRLSPAHKGPNTPPEPPISPPSSPDAYDPFEPTKSRSPTPDPMQSNDLSIVINEHTDSLDGRHSIELSEKSINPMPDVSTKSLTPPLADVQPADSQSSVHASPDSNIDKSPERQGAVQSIQPLVSVTKPIAQTTPFSSVPTSMITSTPISSTLPPSRLNILNSTIIAPTTAASSIPQRIVLPNQVKSSPVKISPTKATIKSTPIKPMPSKTAKSLRKRAQNGSNDDVIMELDSPYSPGSSDYEDLFDPPSEIVTKPIIKCKPKTTAPQKHGSAFDALFGSPSYKTKNNKDKSKFGKKSFTSSKTKTVGVKIDEDNLKILEDLPNSAVEMQVKDKFLKKLNRQERVVEEVKLVLKPYYNKKRISKEEYKDILRRSVPKICHNKSGEINPTKIKNLIEAYVRKMKHSKKVTSSSSVNPQKI